MEQIKDAEQIGKYIKDRMTELNMKPIELATALAKMKTGYTKDQLRDLVYKWLNGDRVPGINYIYYLSKILKVSMESLVVAGEVCEKYDNRPFTLYAIAKSKNFDKLDEIMRTKTPDGTVVGENYDEYDKTILDYVLEFENIDMLKYMFEKEYVSISTYNGFLSTPMRVGGICTYGDIVEKIVSLAIKYDDVELFEKVIQRTTSVWKNDAKDGDVYQKTVNNMGLALSISTINSILDTEHILNYLATSYIPTQEEFLIINQGFVSQGTKLPRVRRLPQIFNLLLECAIISSHKKCEWLASSATKKNIEILKDYKMSYGQENIVDKYGNVREKGSHFGSLTNIAVVRAELLNNIEKNSLKQILRNLVR